MTVESRSFSRAAARRVGFLSSYEGEFRELLLWPQGSPVSIQVVSHAWYFSQITAGESGLKMR